MPAANMFSDTTRNLVRIAAAVAGAPIAVVRRAMADAAGVVPPAEVDEVILQSYLFAGFPRTLNAASAWREISGVAAPPSDASSANVDAAALRQTGEATCARVYAGKYDVLRANVRALHPALDTWMIDDGYGKVLSRPVLGLDTRELCIVAACAAAEQTPQLRSHLRGAMNCGATHEDLSATLAALTDVISRDALAAARDELAAIKES